jgi:hypothetical protein
LLRSGDADQDVAFDAPYYGLPSDDIAPVIADVYPPNDEGLRDQLDDFFGVNSE